MPRSRGFTLIELLIVVVVIAVLASIAYPSYQEQIRKSNRSAAQQFMSDVASRQQQILLDQRGYVSVTANAYFPNAPGAVNSGLNLAVPTEASSKYGFSVTAPALTASAPQPSFTITAVPTGTQAVDGTLTLNSAGVKTPAAKW